MPIRQIVWSLYTLLSATLILAAPARAAEGADAEPAASYLWTDRDAGLTLLEDELAQSPPGGVARWSLYVQMLDVNNDDDFADWAGRTALRLHPDDPTLLKRRIILLHSAPALDVVARLADVPGQAEEAGLIRDIVRLGLTMPGNLDLTGYQAWVAERLLYAGEPDAALRRVEEGLAGKVPARTTPEAYRAGLFATKAMALAMLGRFDEAMAAQALANFPQMEVEGRWQGLGDLLMARGETKRALSSFGGSAPARSAIIPDGRSNEPLRVYALALEAGGDAAGALKLLDVKEPELWDRLLALQILLRAGRPEEAVRRGREFVDPMPEGVAAGLFDSGPQLQDDSRAASLRPEYRAAAGWLQDTFPSKARSIAHEIGGRDTVVRPYNPWPITPLPSSKRIPKLRADLAAATDADERRTLRQSLARALFDAGRFADAADALAPSARVPRDKYGRLNTDAVWWSIYRRQAESEAAYIKDPGALTPARRLLATLGEGRHDPATNRRVGEAPGVAAELVKLGPAVLGPALRRLCPYSPTVGNGTRAAYLPVVDALGGPRDAPPLISLLPTDARDNPSVPPDTLDAALRRLTGETASPAGTDPAKRLAFWLAWWDAHGPDLVDAATARQ